VARLGQPCSSLNFQAASKAYDDVQTYTIIKEITMGSVRGEQGYTLDSDSVSLSMLDSLLLSEGASRRSQGLLKIQSTHDYRSLRVSDRRSAVLEGDHECSL